MEEFLYYFLDRTFTFEESWNNLTQNQVFDKVTTAVYNQGMDWYQDLKAIDWEATAGFILDNTTNNGENETTTDPVPTDAVSSSEDETTSDTTAAVADSTSEETTTDTSGAV